MPRLEALATATPENRVRQVEIQEVAEAYLSAVAPDLLELLPVFQATGIEQRALAEPFDWYLGNPGWAERADAFERHGVELAEQVTCSMLDELGLPPSAIDGVVFVTTTGLATPSLEAHLANRLGLAASIVRVPVWGLGCAGGVAGLARAADLARASPGSRVLIIALELCSLAFLREDLSKKSVVAAALFADGCAGALVAGDELDADGPRLTAAASHLWPESQEVMGWEVRDDGLGVVFSKRIPEIVEAKFGPVCQRLAKSAAVDLGAARLLFHPGGPRVLESFEDALGCKPSRLETSRRVLADHGNMSSPTALFVAAQSLADQPLARGEHGVMAAVGPGFAAELCLLEGAG